MNFGNFRDLCEMFNSRIHDLFDERKPKALDDMRGPLKNVVEGLTEAVRHFEGRKGEVSAEKRQEFVDFCQATIDRMESAAVDGERYFNKGMLLVEKIKQHRESVEFLMKSVLALGPEVDMPLDVEIDLLVKHNELCKPLEDRYKQVWDEMKDMCGEMEALRDELMDDFVQIIQEVFGLQL